MSAYVLLKWNVLLYAMRTRPITVGQVHVGRLRKCGLVKTLTSMKILYLNATFQRLDLKIISRRVRSQDQRSPRHATHHIVSDGPNGLYRYDAALAACPAPRKSLSKSSLASMAAMRWSCPRGMPFAVANAWAIRTVFLIYTR